MLPRREAMVSVRRARRGQILEIERVDRRDRLRLDVIEGPTAARHRSGMPVFELPAGDEHHRVFGVGRSAAEMRSAGTNLARPSASGRFR